MRNFIVKKLVLSTLFVLVLMLIDVILCRFLQIGNLPQFWIIDYSAYLITAVILFLLPLVVQKIGVSLIVVLNAVLTITNLILYNSTGRIFAWELLSLAGEATGVLGWMIIPWLEVLSVFILSVGFIVFCFVYARGERGLYKAFLKRSFHAISISFLIFALVIQTVIRYAIIEDYKIENYFISNSYNYSTFESPYNGLTSYGVFGYYGTSLARAIFPSLAPKLRVNLTDFNFIKYETSLSNVCKNDNVLLIIAESVDEFGISSELTPTVWALKNGVDLSDVGINNFYNISLDGDGRRLLERKDYQKNGDVLETSGVDIYEGLQTGICGLDLINYKSYEVTNNAEMRLLSGNAAASYHYSLPRVLENNGYSTNYIHGNWSSYYTRGTIMETEYGFDNMLFYDNMEGKIESTGDLACFVKDSDIVSYYKAHEDEFDILPDNKFLSVFMTITAHGWYDTSFDYLNDNIELLNAVAKGKTNGLLGCYNSLDEGVLKNAVMNFLSRAIDTEEMVALLVDELYNEGRLDDTVIVWASDHNAYAGDVAPFKSYYYEHGLGKEWNGAYSEYNVPSFIYSTKINKNVISNYDERREVEILTSGIDILPTILSLVGAEYIQERYLGIALMSSSVESSELVYNDVIYSTTYGVMFGDGWMSRDGVKLELTKDITDVERQSISTSCNNLNYKRYFVSHVVSSGDEFVPLN